MLKGSGQVVEQKEKALEMFELAISAAPEDTAPKLKAQLGKLYIGSQEFDKAAPLFADLVELYPDRAAYRYNLGISYSQMKYYRQAIPELEKAVELKPDFCAAYHQLASAYNELKQSGSAIKIAKAGTQSCSADKKAPLYYEWGRGLEGLKRYDEAIDMFLKVGNDATWGSAAKKQIQRQQDLIKRAQVMNEQQGY